MTSTRIREIIRACPALSDCAFYPRSSAYFLPSRLWVVQTLAPVIKQQWGKFPAANERRDCSQAVSIAMALAGDAMAKRTEQAGIAFGRTVGILDAELNGIKGPATHDTCLFIDNTETLWFFEPQNGLTTPASGIGPLDWSALFCEL